MWKHSLDTSMWQRYTVETEVHSPIRHYFQVAGIGESAGSVPSFSLTKEFLRS